MKKIVRLILLTIPLSICTVSAQSYWDIDGSNPGAGGATPAGTWDTGSTANWSTDSTGSSATTVWTDNDDAVFAAGTDATGTYTVDLSGTPVVGDLTVEEGNVTISGGTALNVGGSTASKGVIHVLDGSTLTINSVVTGGNDSGSIQMGLNGGSGTNSGVLVLSGANTYTGQTTVRAGTLSFNSIGNVGGGASALGNPSSAANGAIRLGGIGAVSATIEYTGSGHTTDRDIELAGDTQVNTPGNGIILASGSGALVINGNVNNVVNVTKTLGLGGTSTAQNTINGVISDYNVNQITRILKQDSGTWALMGLNTFSGVFDIRSGTIIANTLAPRGNACSIGTGDYNNANAVIGFGGLGFTDGTLKYVGTGGHSTDRDMRMYGNQGIAGGATLDASGTGPVVFNGSILRPGSGANDIADKTVTLTGSNTDANTLNGGIGDWDYGGPVGKTFLIKDGVGTWVIAGTYTYTGDTTVNGGTLLVNGSLAAGSEVTVVVGILGGNGNIGGPTTIQDGLAPGASVGTLAFGGDLSLSSAAVMSFELDGTDTTVGSSVNDLVTVGGNLILDGTLDVIENGANSFLSATAGDTWRLVDYTGGLTDNGLALGGTMPTLSAGLQFEIDTSTANQVNLKVSAIPEPSALVLGLLGGLGLLVVFRRHRRA